MVKKWEVVQLGPGGCGVSKDVERGEMGTAGCSLICCQRMSRDDARLIVAAVNLLREAAHKANADPLEYAAWVRDGTVDLRGRVTVEVEGGSLLEGIKGGGILKGRTFCFETTDFETVKRLIDWDKASPGHQDAFLEAMEDDDEEMGSQGSTS